MHAFRTVLLAITRTHTTDMELQQTFRLVADNRATLHVVLFDNSLAILRKLQFLPFEKPIEAMMESQLKAELENIRALAWQEGIAIQTHIAEGRPRETILSMITELKCDLVIKLADPSGAFARNQLTGNDLALLRKSTVPVLMMADRNQLPEFTHRIMVAVDVGSPDKGDAVFSKTLLQYGLYLARQEQAELHVVSVWHLPVSQRAVGMLSDEELFELQETIRKRYKAKQYELLTGFNLSEDHRDNVHTHLLQGSPSHEIQELANSLDVDIIVMGTVGKHSRSLMIGNTAENLLNGIYCSVLAVKPEGYASPLKHPANGSAGAVFGS
ncbi:universal stress protein [Candidatus Sororendozoicomonas aggregata]|uniref:universal stress protein n=1 Tax=Candidatus Sororendozoicomonas aggregata TaxID=3073239 RepID=UPI002ED1E71C